MLPTQSMFSLTFASSSAVQLSGFDRPPHGVMFRAGAVLRVSPARQMQLTAKWKLLSKSGDCTRVWFKVMKLLSDVLLKGP